MDGSERGEWIRSIGLHSETNRIWGRINSNSFPYNGTHSFGFALLYDISVYLREHWASRCPGTIVDDIAQFGAVGNEHFGLERSQLSIGFANPYDL